MGSATLKATTVTTHLLIIQQDQKTHRWGDFCDEQVVHLSASLEEGLRLLNRQPIDLVVLQLDLWEEAALESLRELRSCHPFLPIAILIEREFEKLSVVALRDGANDVLFTDTLSAGTLSQCVSLNLERNRRRQIQRELDVAEKVQRNLYPKSGPYLPGYDISGAAYPAEETSGDYFDFLPLPEQTVGLVLGDVSGHGLGPALLMTETRAYFHALVTMWDCLQMELRSTMTVGSLLTHTNRLLSDRDSGYFVSLFFAHLEPFTRTLTYAAAGHQGYLLRDSGEVETLESTGFILGMFPGIEYETAATLVLEPGDILLLPTDGIEETMNPTGEQYNKDRMIEFVQENRHLSANEIVTGLYHSAREFSQGTTQKDDMTTVILKVEK